MSNNVINLIQHKLLEIESTQKTLENNQNKINEIIIELQKNIELLNKQLLNTHETFNGTLHLLLNKNKINTNINMKTFTNNYSDSDSSKNDNLNINSESDTESDSESDNFFNNNEKNKQSMKKTKNNRRIIA